MYYRKHEMNETRKMATTSDLSCQIPAFGTVNAWFTTAFPSLHFSVFCQVYSFSVAVYLWDTLYITKDRNYGQGGTEYTVFNSETVAVSIW